MTPGSPTRPELRKAARNQLAWAIHRTRHGTSDPECDYAKACKRADRVLDDIDAAPPEQMAALRSYLQGETR